EAMKRDRNIDAFVLDDGFQHRKVKRDFDLGLINGTQPFGFGHLLPRVWMREPMKGLGRADALIITRSSQVQPKALASIEETLRHYNSVAPIYRADHVQTGIWLPNSGKRLSIAALAN